MRFNKLLFAFKLKTLKVGKELKIKNKKKRGSINTFNFYTGLPSNKIWKIKTYIHTYILTESNHGNQFLFFYRKIYLKL